MNVLLLGSGGREHALAWKLKQSPDLKELWIAPGNAGTNEIGKNIDLSPLNFPEIRDFVLEKKIDMVIVGPEEPLVRGIQNFFLDNKNLKNIKLIGLSKQAAMLEGSKDFAKSFMKRYKIPTANHKTFTLKDFPEAINYLNSIEPPYVLKADGLAGGKGVIVCKNISGAEKVLEDILKNRKFGSAGEKVVIDHFLEGIELSVFVATDGKSYKILPEAKDYKNIGEGDTGPNTGGMGAISPVPFADKIFMNKVEERIIKPLINGLKNGNIDYKGFLYIGLMNVNGEPFVIEFNVRLGDPETEVIIPRIKSDLLEMFVAMADQKLSKYKIEIDERTAATVILVSQGYPDKYEKGKIISGLENITSSIVFHAGTFKDINGNFATNGGRVLAVTSIDYDMQKAIDISMENAKKIIYEGKYYRKDIGSDLQKYNL
ncbi:MAG: phosphoribosylamine--glycine ligase [Bacteroidetes bacterium]|nr:phosphoribosylamine--glycine ligase [Bacteroidota bacterium]